MADSTQPDVGVVLTVIQPVFRTRGHHAVRLVGALGHKVVYERADIPLVAPDDHGLFTLELKRGVDAGNKPLNGCFLVARGAVELTGAV